MKEQMNDQITEEWKLLEKGQAYNRKIKPDLYNTVDLNERMYAGDQWNGVKSNGLPTPVFNIFKRCIDFLISSILSSPIKVQFTADNIPTDTADEHQKEVLQIIDLLGKHNEVDWEKNKVDFLLRVGLKDAAISGDMCFYSYWDDSIDTGQTRGIQAQTDENGNPVMDDSGEVKTSGVPIMGEKITEVIDNVNVFFGNPNDTRVNVAGKPNQPYILIYGRELVSVLKSEAKKNKVAKTEIDKITSDADTSTQSGDRGKIELDNRNSDDGKISYLIKLWVDKGTIHYRKSTKFVVIQKEIDTGLHLYPVSWFNWESRKNSYHGQAVGTGLVPNQLYINKQFAMTMLFLMQSAYGKVIYDKTRITSWNNQIGAAIAVNGEITNAVEQLNPGQMDTVVVNLIDKTIALTKELIGASDNALGNVDPKNTSAIIATQRAAAIPLEGVKQNLYQFVEDQALIDLDFMMSKYTVPRALTYQEDGQTKQFEFDPEKFQDVAFNVKVDVGPSSYWSEITSMQTLDNLLTNKVISPLQYLERVPDGFINMKQELIEDFKRQMQAQQDMQNQQVQQQQAMQNQQAQSEMANSQTLQQIQQHSQLLAQQQKQADYEKMMQFFKTLPLPVQEKLKSMPDSQMEEELQKLMNGVKK